MKAVDIKNSANPLYYRRGYDYYETSLVELKNIYKEGYSGNEKIFFEASVYGSDEYLVKGSIYENEELHNQLNKITCTCPIGNDFCKHKIATLLEIIDYGKALGIPNVGPARMDESDDQTFLNGIARTYIGFLVGNHEHPDSEKTVEIYQTLYFEVGGENKDYYPEIQYEIGFRGEERYDVPNYYRLPDEMESSWKPRLKFGQFSMSKYKHVFSEEAARIIYEVKELTSIRKKISYHNNNRLVLDEKSLDYFLSNNSMLNLIWGHIELKIMPKIGFPYELAFKLIDGKIFMKIIMQEAGKFYDFSDSGSFAYYLTSITDQKNEPVKLYYSKSYFEKCIPNLYLIQEKTKNKMIEISLSDYKKINESTYNKFIPLNVESDFNIEDVIKKANFTAKLNLSGKGKSILTMELSAFNGDAEYYPYYDADQLDLYTTVDPEKREQLKDFKKILEENSQNHMYKERSKEGQFEIESPYLAFEILNGKFDDVKPDFLEIVADENTKKLFKKIETPEVELSIIDNLLNVDIKVDGMTKQDIKKVIDRLELHGQHRTNFVTAGGVNYLADKETFSALQAHARVQKENKEEIHPIIKIVKAQAIYSTNKKVKMNVDSKAKKMIDNIINYKPQKVQYNINAILRDYQIKGVSWMKQLADLGFSGILADDMGLGKTIQVITYIKNYLKNYEKTIIVVPKALLYNWQNELNKFASEITYTLIDGPPKIRESLIKEYIGDKKKQLLITTYSSLQKDFELLKDVEFDHMFIDEAQHVKNPVAKNHIVVKGVKAKTIFALTGTPIENNLNEFWSIFNILLPGLLGSKKDFSENYIKDADASSNEVLKKTVAPFILRRLKKEVLTELPDKIETPIILELEPKQEKLYNSLHALAKEEVLETLKATGLAKNKIKILALLTRLRQACCYPPAVDNKYKGKNSKIELLNELVEELMGSNHRILLFSQFTTVLKEIEKNFQKLKIKTLYLDGKTKAKDRQELTKQFNEDTSIPIFLISLKAGGTGLNLTGADTVIHFDPWWNPSIENQASDRAYRMGQEKNVQVIKLICKNTIEEKIVELQNKKQALINDVLNNEEQAISSLSEAELLDLFDIN